MPFLSPPPFVADEYPRRPLRLVPQRGVAYRGVAVLTLLACGGCASYEAPVPVVSIFENRQKNVVMQEWDTSCGAAALATLLNFQHGYPVSEAGVAQAMLRQTEPLRVKTRGGFSLLDLKRYVQSQGFAGEGYRELTVEDLVELGPAIIPVEIAYDHHFVVFRAVAGNKVLLADPGFGNVTFDIDAFERAWSQRIAFVVTRPDEADPPNRLQAYEEDFVAVPDTALRRALR